MRNPYNLLNYAGYAREYRTAVQSKVNVNQALDFITEGLSANFNISYDYSGEMIVRRIIIQHVIMRLVGMDLQAV